MIIASVMRSGWCIFLADLVIARGCRYGWMIATHVFVLQKMCQIFATGRGIILGSAPRSSLTLPQEPLDDTVEILAVLDGDGVTADLATLDLAE